SSVATAEEGERIAATLVQERLAACVHVLPVGVSWFFWEGKVTQESEHLIFIKTTQDLYPQLQERIETLHSYQTPEIIALPILQGSADYLQWMASVCVRNEQNTT
ncbi:MAG: divalent-cation tolerance protein CutA, partial [Nitrospinota bacterium]